MVDTEAALRADVEMNLGRLERHADFAGRQLLAIRNGLYTYLPESVVDAIIIHVAQTRYFPAPDTEARRRHLVEAMRERAAARESERAEPGEVESEDASA